MGQLNDNLSNDGKKSKLSSTDIWSAPWQVVMAPFLLHGHILNNELLHEGAISIQMLSNNIRLYFVLEVHFILTYY